MEDEIFEQLLIIQEQVEEDIYPHLGELNQEEQMLIYTRAMIHETIEVERELNWKHWKRSFPVNDDAIKGEIVDQFIFLMNEINISGMDANELFERTIDKIAINIDRQSSGY